MDHPADRPTRVKKKDRTGVWISFGAHVGVIVIALIILSQTELGRQLKDKLIGTTRDQQKQQDKPKPPPAQPRQGPRRAVADAPPASSGPRRAADAPAAVGESFFSETTEKKSGPSSGGEGSKTNVTVKVAVPVVKVAPPKIFSSAAPKSDIKQLLAERSKAAASTEAFGTEQIAKSGVSDAGAILKQISGATVSDGKYAVIRGLNDRYISTTLNGANLPSADPYRQSAPLDLFPAQVIDRVVVSKTFTPDQPGTSTGGGIDVVTKSFPERNFLTMSLGGEYNTQSSLNDRFLSYTGGDHDWAGMDDGTRALPSEVNRLAPPGKQLPDAPISSGVIGTPLYFQNISNATLLDKVSRKMGTTEFAPKHETSPLNHNFSAAAGGTTHLLGMPLGYFAGTSYKHDYWFYENGISSRYDTGTELKNKYRDTRALDIVNWSGMVNLAYQPVIDHELGFTFFYNQNGTDDSRIQDQGFEKSDTSGTYRKFNLYYTERNLTTYQIKGSHLFPTVADLQFNWLVALTQTTQDEPDARFFNDGTKGGEYSTIIGGVPSPSKPTRYFRTLDEDNRNVKLDWTLPLRIRDVEEGQFKFGLFNSFSERTFGERQFYYPGHGGYQNNPNLYLAEDQLGLVSVQTNFLRGVPRSLTFNWGDYVQVFDSSYNGDRKIQAGYLMLDVPVVEKLRLVGGARYETTDLSVHSESYLESSITSLKTNDAHLVQSDLLPSAGLIYSVTSNMNVRLSYSQTIARPSFRELAAYYSYDPIVSDYVEGNPLLTMTAIKNYDIRWEWFPRPGELFGVSLFYKDLKDAIERGNVKGEGDVITFFNNDAKLYGIEFEARKSLDFLDPALGPFSLGGNLSLVWSEVKLRTNDLSFKRSFFPNASSTRPLYDQSPYILNLDLSYSNPSLGTSATIIYNVAGPRIAITKLNTEDVYEEPTPTVDFIISQRVGRNLTLKFGAKNLLNPKIERTYGKDSNLLYSSYTKGRSFGLSMAYDF
jgi:outer membrane receptor protein involved in Fe transport